MRSPLAAWRAASRRRRIFAAVFAGYIGVSLAVSDFIPFCVLDMFAQKTMHAQTASFRVEGAPDAIWHYRDFEIDLPEEVQHSLLPNGADRNLTLDEMYSYVRQHRAWSDPRGPAVAVEFDLLTTEWDEAASRPSVSARLLCRGTARRIP